MAKYPEDVAWVFGIDDDDQESKRILANEPHVIVKAGGGSVPAFNAAAAHGPVASIYIGGADDTYAPKGWDQDLILRMGDVSKPAVLLTGDGRRMDRMATCPIVTRGWYEKFGWLFPPEFRTMGPDAWLSERASRDGCYIDALDLVFEHKHPYYGHGEVDEVYERHNAPEGWVHTREVFFRLLEKLPISLCMIVGNEEDKIIRCLESAKDAFDELCIVVATGGQPQDDTISMARAWCADNDKVIHVGEHYNKRSMPWHIDDFSDARGLSFDLATSYWCLWLNADEILTPQACTGIRECAANTRFDCHSFRTVNPDGGEYYQARLVKRGKGKWEGRVFEQCKVDGYTARVKEVEIKHEPGPVKDPGMNLRILESIPNKEKTPGEWYHYHEELFRAGKLEEARHAGDKALTDLPEGSVEQYEALLNMADLLPDKDALQELEVAVHLHPYRREALAGLCQRHLANRNIVDATAYFRMMDSLPTPRPKPCNHRPAWYRGGWACRDLRWQIMRVNGLHKDAYEEEKKWFAKQEDPVTLAIICPIEKSEEGIVARVKWLAAAKHPERVQPLIVGGNILEWYEFAVVRDTNQLCEVALAPIRSIYWEQQPTLHWDVDTWSTLDETRSRGGADRVAAAAT